jgi:cytochrome c oxidase assembly protein subunit 15
MWLHRFAAFVAASTVLLIVAGGLVTSTGSGLAVPDWPTTYGWSMFTFPLDKMVGGIRYEHGHRLIATSVGLLTIGLTVWLWLAERRRWLRRLGVAALAAVCVQGLLGGLTVLFFLPAPISIAHAGLAQIFFCLTISITLFTSRAWHTMGRQPPVDDVRLRMVASASTAAIYLQILVGATMRHTQAGLAIPDFPLVFGGLFPPEWTTGIAVHYAHRVGALIVACAIFLTAGHVWYRHRSIGELTRPAVLAVVLVLVQISLGGLTVLSRRAVSVNTAHVVTGALLLATSLVITLRSWRVRFAWGAEQNLPAGFARSAELSREHSSAGARA